MATISGSPKTAIVTGAAQGIGAGIVKAFVERGFNVVANSRKVTQSTEVAASNQVALVDGHIGEPPTAARIVQTALHRFKSIDVLVNDAGIIFNKPFTDYTAEDFKSLTSTNLEGFLYITQLVIKQMLAQKTGGSIVTITAALARNPNKCGPISSCNSWAIALRSASCTSRSRSISSSLVARRLDRASARLLILRHISTNSGEPDGLTRAE